MNDIYEVEPTTLSQPKPATRRRRRKKAKRTVAPKQVAPPQRAVPRIPAPEPAALAPPPPAPVAPAPPSPAVLKLQEQIVDLVAQRSIARTRLSEAHAAYLTAQSAFQVAEAGVKAAEQDAQYLLSLIAQLENRTPPAVAAPVLQMPSMSGVSSEPAPIQGGPKFATASADDLRREMRGMM